MKAYVIPVEGPVQELELSEEGDSDLAILQAAVGGSIEALPFRQDPKVTVYIHEEGKFERLPINRRATDIMLATLFHGDYIAGPMVVCGFNAHTGAHRDLPELPQFMRLVLAEAAL